jgi:uncharacterized protein (DUF1810 family)
MATTDDRDDTEDDRDDTDDDRGDTDDDRGDPAAGDDLERFVEAQDAGGTYHRAVAELRRGRKSSHWMWFVFPQIAGLGRSELSQRFAISSLSQARAYLRHPVLGPRLSECASILAHLPDRDAEQIFGAVDAQKLRSSMTLFARAAADQTLFVQVLERYFDGVPDSATDQRLGGRVAAAPREARIG